MSDSLIGLISFAVIFGSAMLGMLIRRRFPEHHLRDDSDGIIKVSRVPLVKALEQIGR